MPTRTPHPMPTGTTTSRVAMPDGQLVEVRLDWDYVASMARKALKNKTRQSAMGPLLVRQVKP